MPAHQIKLYKGPQGIYATLEIRGIALDLGFSASTEAGAIENLRRVWKVRKREIDALFPPAKGVAK